MESVAGLTSVIVVACNSGALLADCIASVLGSTAPVEVFVSDNDSRDGSIEALQTRWPELRVLRNGTNLGFGVSCSIDGFVDGRLGALGGGKSFTEGCVDSVLP